MPGNAASSPLPSPSSGRSQYAELCRGPCWVGFHSCGRRAVSRAGQNQPATGAWVPLLALGVVSGALLYPCLSFYLFEPDEGRYAQIPREMLRAATGSCRPCRASRTSTSRRCSTGW